MQQPPEVEHLAEPAGEAAHGAPEAFNAGETIIGHVANSPLDHPLIHLPTVAGIDLSVTKHVLMLWIAAGVLFLIVTAVVRRYLRQDRRVPSGFMTDTPASAPPVGFVIGTQVREPAVFALPLPLTSSAKLWPAAK